MSSSDSEPAATGLRLPAYGLGTAALGEMFTVVSSEQAQTLFSGALERGIRYIDTAPMYGLSTAERRLGHFLESSGQAGRVMVSTKVGRLMRPRRWPGVESGWNEFGWCNPGEFVEVYDYSYEGVLRSVEDSLQRLGLARLDAIFIHDIGRVTHGDRNEGYVRALRDGGYRALTELKEADVVGAIGVGVNEADALVECLDDIDLDCCLLANQFTLLDQPAPDVFRRCAERGVQLIAGGVYASGILAGGDHYRYRRASVDIVRKVEQLREVCERYEVPLRAAAMQFVGGSPFYACVMLGARTLKELDDSLASASLPIPTALWRELVARELVHEQWLSERLEEDYQ